MEGHPRGPEETRRWPEQQRCDKGDGEGWLDLDCILEIDPTNVLKREQKFRESPRNKTRPTPSSAHQGTAPRVVHLL